MSSQINIINWLPAALLIILSIFSSCNKSTGTDNSSNDACNLPELRQTSFASVHRPCGIAVSKNGLVAICEYNGFEIYGGAYGSAGKTYVYRSYSDLLTKAAPFFTLDNQGAEAVAFDQNENLYVAETEAVAGIAVYQNLNIYLPSVFAYRKTSQGEFINPRGLAFDSHDRLYVANDGVGNIIRIDDPMGIAKTQSIGYISKGIKGLAIAEDTIFCTSYNTGEIMTLPLNSDGTLGQLNHTGILTDRPVDISVNDQTIAVSRPESGTISLFERNGFIKADYAGCTRDIHVGTNTFGLAFLRNTASKTAILAAQLDQNQIIYFESKN